MEKMDPPGFDLHQFLGKTPLYSAAVFNNLVRFDPNKEALIPQNIIPDLAERWEVSPDGKTVVAFLDRVGDQVKAGQPLAVMEAMKMEHTIASPRDGTVAELLYAVGDQVDEGGELLRLEAAAQAS